MKIVKNHSALEVSDYLEMLMLFVIKTLYF